jgi:predicted O-methyltransferase YrrM
MISSYEKNNYAEVFYSIVTAWRPVNCVELGVLHGYSTLAIGEGLRAVSFPPYNVRSHLSAYDLFEDYPFNHGKPREVQQKINEAGLQDFITLHKEDAWRVHERHADQSVALLHVDLSNTGETVRKIMPRWDPKLPQGGIILFEGGTEERDQVEWMIKNNAAPIKPELETNPIIAEKYIFGTYLKYPGLTFLLKKRP